MSPKERNMPKKLGLGENPMKNYWFDLCYSAINGVCLMYLENVAGLEINFKSQFTDTQRFHIFRLIIAHLHSFKFVEFLALGISNQSYLPLGQEAQLYYLLIRSEYLLIT